MATNAGLCCLGLMVLVAEIILSDKWLIFKLIKMNTAIILIDQIFSITILISFDLKVNTNYLLFAWKNC